MILHNTLSVFRFELRRTITVSRVGVWLLLVFFPVFIVGLMKYYEGHLDFGQESLGGRRETLMAGAGVRVDIGYRHGQRVATLRLGRGRSARKL